MSIDRDDLGRLSSRYESRGDPSAIGYDSTGGHSYGTYQIATRTGTFKNFMEFLKLRYIPYYNELMEAGGAKAAMTGSSVFKDKWRTLAKELEFARAQHRFIQYSHFDVAARLVNSAIGLDIEEHSNALQDVLWSTAVQHGPSGARNVFIRALGRTGKMVNEVDDDEMIVAVYDERGANDGTKYFRRSSSRVRQSVCNRFLREKKEALEMLKNV